jgi:hypothetical protein
MTFRKRLMWMIPGVALIFLLFINESLNCEAMVKLGGNLPYHAATEVVGGIIFYALADSFLKWERESGIYKTNPKTNHR